MGKSIKCKIVICSIKNKGGKLKDYKSLEKCFSTKNVGITTLMYKEVKYEK